MPLQAIVREVVKATSGTRPPEDNHRTCDGRRDIWPSQRPRRIDRPPLAQSAPLRNHRKRRAPRRLGRRPPIQLAGLRCMARPGGALHSLAFHAMPMINLRNNGHYPVCRGRSEGGGRAAVFVSDEDETANAFAALPLRHCQPNRDSGGTYDPPERTPAGSGLKRRSRPGQMFGKSEHFRLHEFHELCTEFRKLISLIKFGA
jgi:hypothetical protein